MNKSEFEDNFYMITFELKTNIVVPNSNSLPKTIADGLNALYQLIDCDSVDVTTMTINSIRDSYEDKVNYVAFGEREQAVEEEKDPTKIYPLKEGDDYIA